MNKITKENKKSSKKGIVALKDELMKSIISFRDHVKMDGELYRTNSENLVRDILNTLFGSNLINANTIKKDFVGIDLVDEDKRFVVQVSTASKMENQKKKIKETLEKFEQIKFLQNYNNLLIVFILELTPNFNFKKQKPDQNMILNYK